MQRLTHTLTLIAAVIAVVLLSIKTHKSAIQNKINSRLFLLNARGARHLSALPDFRFVKSDLRGDIDPTHTVRVVVEDLGLHDDTRKAVAERVLRLAGIAGHKNTSIEAAVARVRALRDEWD